MLRNTKVQMAAILAVGALLGYVAASGWLNPFSSASAGPTPGEGAAVKPAGPGGGGDPKEKTTFSGAQQNGKKPNILVIMGDDIGWFNIGAYHRGMMSGKTPNLDKLAAQ